jgi:hypothetical protein
LFHRVNYSEANWNQLFKTLNDNHLSIHRLNRAQIIKDSLTLAKAGVLQYSFALQSTKYLKKEFDFIPWTTAVTELDYIGQMLIESNALVNYNSTITNYDSTITNYDSTFKNYDSTIVNYNSTIVNYNSAYENYKSYIFQQLGPIFHRLGLKQSDWQLIKIHVNLKLLTLKLI